MKNRVTIAALFMSLFIFDAGYAQCSIQALADSSLSLKSSVGGSPTRTGVAFNPSARLFYSVNGGSSFYPIDTFTHEGVLVDSTTSGFDYRGGWWNPSTSQFEGNGYGDGGIYVHVLSASSYPSGAGVTVLAANQPDLQSVGDLDYDSDEILYYFDGFVNRYNRSDNLFVGSYSLQNVPVALNNLNSNTVAYTGCAGQEIVLYDYVNKNALFFNKGNGEYVGASQLPATAPVRASFGMSYARGRLFLYDSGAAEWKSYVIVATGVAVEEDASIDEGVDVYPNPVRDYLTIDSPGAAKVRLTNILGQLVYSWDVSGNEPVRASVSNQPAGVYILSIDNGRGLVSRKITKID